MSYFPFFEKIDNKCFLIVGGGRVAAEKAARLSAFTDRITVVAAETAITGVSVIRRGFEESDLDAADYCICATDDHEENARIAALCRGRHIPVNVVDDPDLCSFIFPALIKKGDLAIGISTSGSSPTCASYLRRQIEDNLPEHIEEVLDQMGALRKSLPEEEPDAAKRREIYREELDRLLSGKRKKIRIATRGSALSLIQTEIVAGKLAEAGFESEELIVKPKGDRDKQSPLTKIGGDGLFVRGLEEKLLSGEADIAVHSAKDLPYELAEGLVIGCVPDAADPRDVLLMRTEAGDVEKLLAGHPTVGTDSPRRREDMRHLCPGAEFKSLRGNVPTRINKLRDGQYDAIVLAKAGLDRLGTDLTGIRERLLSIEELTPAPCQGILAVECRASDTEMFRILQKITDREAQKRFEIERYLFAALKADCAAPVGVYAQIEGETVRINGSFRDRKAVREGKVSDYRRLCDEIKEEIYIGSVTLVGAGPGAGTLTLDGLEAIRKAQVICYDHLIDQQILQYAPEGCEKIPVGKRGGRHMMKQEEITKLLIDLALCGHQVVRLKGGDPFVFGRGSEEALALREHHIPFEVVPGVSSAIAVPESFGIPVTHRGTASSFTVVTGHGADGRSLDYNSLAHAPGTLVILMGLHNLRELTGQLLSHGMDPDRPAAVLSQGFSPEARRYDGSVATIADAAREAQAPAIIIIGDVTRINLRETEGFCTPGPLAGGTVEIAGTKDFNRKLAAMLRAAGMHVIETEVMRIVSMPEKLVQEVTGYTWVALTSPNGVRALAKALSLRGMDFGALTDTGIACSGPGTAEALSRYGRQADLVPKVHSATGLSAALTGVLKERDRVLVIRGETASPDLVEGLEAAGVSYDSCTLYRTEETAIPEQESAADMIVFSSALAAKAYLKKRAVPKTATVICMGKKAAGETAAHTDALIKVTKQNNLQGLYELIQLSVREKEEGR